MLAVLLVAIAVLAQTATPPATPSPVDERCTAVPPSLIDWVSEGIYPDSDAELGITWMVKSDDFENVWFVASDIGITDEADVVALWATNAPTEDGEHEPGDGGLVLTVNDVAGIHTDWFPSTEYDVSDDDDGADLALDCVNPDRHD